MNATDFIKHYGLNTAIRITEDSKNDDFWDTETGFYTDKNSESCVCLSDLKRLVESVEVMKSEFESREAFECIFGDKGEIDLSKDETGEYSFQPSRFAYSFFLLAWQYRQTEVDELTKQRDSFIKAYEIEMDESVELQKRVDALTLALDQIAYPIPHMQKEAELNGCELNGYWAVKMSEDHTYSKDIARRALEKEQALKGGGDE